MNPHQALKHINFIIDTQKTVSTSKLKELVQAVSSHNKMLYVDNKDLRKRIKRQRVALRGMNDD